MGQIVKVIVYVYFGLVFLDGCASRSTENENLGPKTTLHVSVINTDIPLSGNTFYFGEDQSPQPVGNQGAIMNYIREKLSAKLIAGGFTVAPEYRKARLTADTAVFKMLPEEKAATIAREKVPVAAQVDLYSVLFGLSVRSYGMRPKEILSVKIVGTLASLADVEAVQQEIDRIVGALALTAPAKNKRMPGDPSCMPSFGYAFSNAVPGSPGVVVVSIKKKSPAAKAGMKVGDRLVSAGGVPFVHYLLPENSGEFDKHYESKTPVTFVVDRAGQPIEFKMMGKISCGL